jgi:flavorubredoxin
VAGRFLIAFLSAEGAVEMMAQYIAEGLRVAGHEADVRDITEIGDAADLAGYDGYVIGCPTYHLDMPEPMRRFLLIAEGAGLDGKAGGAFSARVHPGGPGGAAALIFWRMESALRMRMTDLGPFDLITDDLFDRPDTMRACQDYGKAMGALV